MKKNKFIKKLMVVGVVGVAVGVGCDFENFQIEFFCAKIIFSREQFLQFFSGFQSARFREIGFAKQFNSFSVGSSGNSFCSFSQVLDKNNRDT